jgi:hypothetical protein
MIGFSLKIDKESTEKIGMQKTDYNDFLQSYQNTSQNLFLFDDKVADSLITEDYTLYAIGTLVYKDRWRWESLEEIQNDLRKGVDLSEIMKNTHGQFCLIIHHNGTVKIVTDKMATFPIYMYDDSSTVHVSNIFLNIVRNNPVTLDYQAISEYLSFSYYFNAPLFNEIRLMDHGTIYHFSNDHTVTQYDNFLANLDFGKYKDLDEATEEAKDLLVRNFSFLGRNQEKYFVDLTGGMDSRLNSNILHNLGIKFEAGICGQQKVNEEKYAKQISEILGIKHHSNIKIRDMNLFLRYVDENFEISNGVPILLHSTELLNYYHNIKENFDLHIAGFAGSQIFDNFLPQLSLSRKIRSSNLMKKQFNFYNIFKDDIIRKQDFERRLSDKIYEWLDRLGTRDHDKAARYFTTTVYSKFYHGSVIGAHNTILPVYVPYLEADMVRLTLQCAPELIDHRLLERSLITHFNEEVSRVLTTHGFSANVNAIQKKSTIHTVKDLLRRFAYDIDWLYSLSEFIKKKFKPLIKFAELERDFWLDQIDNEWSEDMKIFELIDKNKLRTVLEREIYSSQLKAKILYVNRLLTEVNR